MNIPRPKSILIVKLSAIGDVVHTLPLLEVLRKNFPEARIDWVVEEEASRIIDGHNDIDHVIVSHRKSWQKSLLKPGGRSSVLRDIREFLRKLRSQEYDLIIDVQGLFKSGILTGLSKGRRKIGFTGGREGSSFFLTEPPHFFDYNLHALDRYLKAAEYLDCRCDSWKGDIPIRPSDKRVVEQLLSENRLDNERLLAINPMARWKTKLWEPARFARLADMIAKESSARVIFTGGPQDRAVVDEIVAQMESSPVNLTGRTSLKALAHLYSRCRLLITTDTGPMHIAAAMGTPVVALFGPTAPWRTGPYGKTHVVIREDMECSPCFKKRCAHLTCMKSIRVEKVFESARPFLT